MKTIPPVILDLLHSRSNPDALVLLMQFDLPAGDPIRYARYGYPIEYGGHTYEPWPVAAQLAGGSRGPEVPEYTITLDDSAQVLLPHTLATDWFRGCTLTTTVVCVAHLSLDYAWSTRVWNILHAVPDDVRIVMTIGGRNIAQDPCPRERHRSRLCRYVRGFAVDPRCGYSGDETTCNGTIEDCVARSNEERWGGDLGLDQDAAVLVLPRIMAGRI